MFTLVVARSPVVCWRPHPAGTRQYDSGTFNSNLFSHEETQVFSSVSNNESQVLDSWQGDGCRNITNKVASAFPNLNQYCKAEAWKMGRGNCNVPFEPKRMTRMYQNSDFFLNRGIWHWECWLNMPKSKVGSTYANWLIV